MGLAFVPLIANQKIKSVNVMKLMVIEQSNMEAKRFTGYSQGRGARFSGLGGPKLFLLPPPSLSLSSSSFSSVVLVEAGGSGPPDPLASAAPGYSYEMQVCKSHIIT